MYYIFNATVKCYCEDTNGTNVNNSILCGKDKNLTRSGHCGAEDICIGSSTGVYALNKEAMCAKGTFKLYEIQIIYGVMVSRRMAREIVYFILYAIVTDDPCAEYLSLIHI